MFYKDLIIPKLIAEDRWNAIEQLAERMHKNDFVLSNFAELVKDREKKAPTALDVGAINVAIPHDGIEACLQPGIAIGILEKTVPWIEITTDDRWLDVRVIFLLSITEPEKHAGTLKILVDLIQKPKFLDDLCAMDSERKILQFIGKELNNSKNS